MANTPDEQRSDSSPYHVEFPRSGGGNFEIRVKGHLDDTWLDWLDGLSMKRCDNGEMILTGTIMDQAALLGVLNKLNRLNLPLLSVTQVDRSDRP